MKKLKQFFAQFKKDSILHFTGGMLIQLFLQIWFYDFRLAFGITVAIAILIELIDYFQSGRDWNRFSRGDLFSTILGAILALWMSHVYIPIL